ncbi:MAG TPA: protease pro-enzyme activation domain-containing protein [Candidatus Binatia bacterium]|jgi:hypothetical protein|nr:protease pro-enzyme activation domain-containing protein [Candidatus Binatia bacterium]
MGFRWSGFAFLLAVQLGSIVGSSGGAHAERLPDHVLPALATATRVAAAPDAAIEPITLTFVLRRDDPAGFAELLRAVRDETSPSYRRFTSQRALADRFGPSPRTYDRLRRWLTGHGLELVQGAENRLTLTVRGTRAAVERTMRVGIADYRIGDRTFRANDTNPALPRALASHVLSVTGLSDLAQPKPVLKALHYGFNKLVCAILVAPVPPPIGFKLCTNGDPNPYNVCLAAAKTSAENNVPLESVFDFAGYGQYYSYLRVVRNDEPCPPGSSPAAASSASAPKPTVRKGIAPRAAGTGQTIGIIGFDTLLPSDVADYLTLVGFPATNIGNLTLVPVNGGATLGADQDELLLDVTTAMTIAPGAQVKVFHAPFTGQGSFQALFNAALDGGATVISNSFAYCEDQTSRADVEGIEAIFQSAAASNVSVFNASGDSGSTCLNGSPNTVAVPASAPTATAVGGSSVTAGGGRARAAETWWDGTASVPPTGQGGFGTSRFFARPAYQNGFNASAMRSVPDLVASADPAGGIMICQASAGGCPTGSIYGGTSFTAPVLASYTALINEAIGRNVGFLNEEVYPLAGTRAFNDAADLGSDFAHVGLGSPNVDALIVALGNLTLGAADPLASYATAAVDTDVVGGFQLPVEVPADGTSVGYVSVQVLDAAGHAIPGQTVAISAPGTDAVITPGSMVSDDYGLAVFAVTNLTAEDVEFTVTVNGVELGNHPTLPFVVPPATSASIQASTNTVTADGIASATITVTLQDALARGAAGKTVTLSQGLGHSRIATPSPAVTDANGQIAFTITNLVNEVVTYTAVDVTDGDLPVPGSAQVTFENGTGTACGNTVVLPVGQNGYVVTAFATGFLAQDFNFGNVNWGGCPGASNPVFQDASTYIAQFPDGGLYGFGLGGGAVSSANLLDVIGPTLGSPVFGKDGKLYATRGSTGVNFTTGTVVELDPATGAFIRNVAENQTCPGGLAVDPISGDLFFTGTCFGAGADDVLLHRILDPAGPTPTVVTYANLGTSPNGAIAFTPDGTIYVAIGYNSPVPPVVRITGTNSATPGVVTPVTGLSSFFTLSIGELLPNGEAKSFLVFPKDTFDLSLVDVTTTPFTTTVLATDIGSGTTGPDGCQYIGSHDAVYKLTNASGGCNFLPTAPLPSLVLTPAEVTPDPARGTTREVTATFRYVDVPADTPIFFQVTGANPQVRMVRTNAEGAAVFAYTAVNTGKDTITATATIAGTALTSNPATITWTDGPHVTSLTLNLSPTQARPSQPVTVVASLTDVSVEPPAPLAGQPVAFDVGGVQCAGTTDPAGTVICIVTLPAPGTSLLAATFAGAEVLLPSSDAVGFTVVSSTAPLGAFMLHQAKTTKKTPTLPKFGPVTLGAGAFDVQKITELGVPADIDDAGLRDPTTHLLSYAVKPAKGGPKIGKQSSRVVGACTNASVTTSKPTNLLVPTAKGLTQAADPLVPNAYNVDHLLCAKVKGKVALAKHAQVEVTDQLQSGRYDLRKLTLVCSPVAKSGSPTVKSGPAKGQPFSITPATVRNPSSLLLCYDAKLATKTYAQSGCGAANPKDKGTKISPKQPKPTAHTGVYTDNQFGTGQVDTKKPTTVCLPAALAPQ